MKDKIIQILAATLGVLLTPLWLPITLILYLVDKWRKKGQ